MTKCDGSENRVTKKELYLFKWKWEIHERKWDVEEKEMTKEFVTQVVKIDFPSPNVN